MDQATHNKIVSFIWGIADDVLRDLFKRGKYPDVILPMCVIRRMDAVLEPTKQAVLDTKKMLDEARITEQRTALCDAAGQAFYNASRFTLRDLKSRGSQQQLLADFEDYLNGFSPNVQDIIENFKFRNQLTTLSKADAIGTLINKFLDPDIDLSPAGIDNHSMGTVFEELVRKFNEENNEEAGEHWTPRDAVRLMANLVFLPIETKIKSGTYLLYDCACGTGGMLTVGEETLTAIGAKRAQQVKCLLYGQEINPETYAVCKADMLLKGEGESAESNKLLPLAGGLPRGAGQFSPCEPRPQLRTIFQWLLLALWASQVHQFRGSPIESPSEHICRSRAMRIHLLPITPVFGRANPADFGTVESGICEGGFRKVFGRGLTATGGSLAQKALFTDDSMRESLFMALPKVLLVLTEKFQLRSGRARQQQLNLFERLGPRQPRYLLPLS